MTDAGAPSPAPKPSEALLRCCREATAQLEPLLEIVAPLAKSRPDAPVSRDVLGLARRALRAVTPVARALGAPVPLPLHTPVTNAGLAARLAIAAQQARTFRRQHFAADTTLEAIVWHMEDRTLALAQGLSPDDGRAT